MRGCFGAGTRYFSVPGCTSYGFFNTSISRLICAPTCLGHIDIAVSLSSSINHISYVGPLTRVHRDERASKLFKHLGSKRAAAEQTATHFAPCPVWVAYRGAGLAVQTGGHLGVVALIRQLDGVLHDVVPRHVCRVHAVLLRLPLGLVNSIRLQRNGGRLVHVGTRPIAEGSTVDGLFRESMGLC